MRDGRIGGERQGVENNILVNKNGKKKTTGNAVKSIQLKTASLTNNGGKTAFPYVKE